jgi:hypothetical protein
MQPMHIRQAQELSTSHSRRDPQICSAMRQVQDTRVQDVRWGKAALRYLHKKQFTGGMLEASTEPDPGAYSALDPS